MNQSAFFESTNHSGVLACIYKASKDKTSKQQKVVYMLSTCHSTHIVYTGKSNKDGNCIMKPAIARSYNQHMRGVDCVDQQLLVFCCVLSCWSYTVNLLTTSLRAGFQVYLS